MTLLIALEIAIRNNWKAFVWKDKVWKVRELKAIKDNEDLYLQADKA